ARGQRVAGAVSRVAFMARVALFRQRANVADARCRELVARVRRRHATVDARATARVAGMASEVAELGRARPASGVAHLALAALLRVDATPVQKAVRRRKVARVGRRTGVLALRPDVWIARGDGALAVGAFHDDRDLLAAPVGAPGMHAEVAAGADRPADAAIALVGQEVD